MKRNILRRFGNSFSQTTASTKTTSRSFAPSQNFTLDFKNVNLSILFNLISKVSTKSLNRINKTNLVTGQQP